MDKLRIGLLGSGEGTTIKAVCEAVQCDILDLKIDCIITNYNQDETTKLDNMNNIGGIFKINSVNLPNNNLSREDYNKLVVKELQKYDLDFVVLAGWNFIVNDYFINSFKLVINLHPALPNTFVGQNCIKKAYDAFQQGEIHYTGSMVHQVIEEVDKGEVLNTIKVPIYNTDSYKDLETRVKSAEKGILIQTIQSLINGHNQNIIDKNINKSKIYNGKVRRVEDIGYGCLLLSASNRISAFDKHITDISNKGIILNNISVWWFNKTKHIIDNHYLYHKDNHMIVKKTKPIKLEIVVRGYMTGSTNTSIWPMYKRGERNIYGIDFRENYSKNEQLDKIIITPTTKGINDLPITPNEIIKQNYLSQKQWTYISDKAIELFKFGQEEAAKKGLILVDTKYEFGWLNDKIILIDELHTCDSSRYWLQSSYDERFNNGLEPEKMDKDAIRDWVKKNCDPYNESIPKIPKEVIENVESVYTNYHKMLTNNDVDSNTNIHIDNLITNYFVDNHKQIVVILAGSIKDSKHIEKIKSCLDEHDIYSIHYYSSAHKNTKEVLSIINDHEQQDRAVVYVTVAGRSNALSGVVASNTKYPTIACPPFKDNIDMSTNINSTLMCPSKVPVMTILEPGNVAISIKKIFNLMN